jgi:hypothetical protein
VDKAIRGGEIGRQDGGHPTLFIGDGYLVAVQPRRQDAAFHCCQFRRPTVPADEADKVRGGYPTGDHMIRQNGLQFGLIFGFQERLDGAFGQVVECLVRRGEDRERTRAGQCAGQVRRPSA